jgi:hypothetical protein
MSGMAKRLLKRTPKKPSQARRAISVAGEVKARIDAAGERVWQLEDFRDLPFLAVAQALSRLCRAGVVRRLSKGVYYRGRATKLGPSRPSPSALRQLAERRRPMFPAGLAAANLLSFTTQTAARGEVSTSASNLPRKLVGAQTVVHTRRPAAWAKLTEIEAALLDFLRQGGHSSELSPEATLERTLALLNEPKRFHRLAKVASTEPPRVRALLGALGQALEADPNLLRRLRHQLNPLSRFSFGIFAILPTTRDWQPLK